jgi:hypothetical protein
MSDSSVEQKLATPVDFWVTGDYIREWANRQGVKTHGTSAH